MEIFRLGCSNHRAAVVTQAVLSSLSFSFWGSSKVPSLFLRRSFGILLTWESLGGSLFLVSPLFKITLRVLGGWRRELPLKAHHQIWQRYTAQFHKSGVPSSSQERVMPKFSGHLVAGPNDENKALQRLAMPPESTTGSPKTYRSGSLLREIFLSCLPEKEIKQVGHTCAI